MTKVKPKVTTVKGLPEYNTDIWVHFPKPGGGFEYIHREEIVGIIIQEGQYPSLRLSNGHLAVVEYGEEVKDLLKDWR